MTTSFADPHLLDFSPLPDIEPVLLEPETFYIPPAEIDPQVREATRAVAGRLDEILLASPVANSLSPGDITTVSLQVKRLKVHGAERFVAPFLLTAGYALLQGMPEARVTLPPAANQRTVYHLSSGGLFAYSDAQGDPFVDNQARRDLLQDGNRKGHVHALTLLEYLNSAEPIQG